MLQLICRHWLNFPAGCLEEDSAVWLPQGAGREDGGFCRLEYARPVQRQPHRFTHAHQRALLRLRRQPHAAGDADVTQAKSYHMHTLSRSWHERHGMFRYYFPLPPLFCQTKVHGKDRVKFMESLVVADIAELKDNQVRRTWSDNHVPVNLLESSCKRSIESFFFLGGSHICEVFK